MYLREENIIVCECGVELNPEITTEYDFITYADGVATCSNCGASGEIVFPQPELVDTGPTIDERVTVLEGTITEFVTTLNDKGLIP